MVGTCWITSCYFDQQEIEAFLSFLLRSVRNSKLSCGRMFRRGTLICRLHSAAQICCANSNQDLSESCWSQCSSCQQQLAELGCHILAPTPTSSSTYVAPTLTTSWGPGQTAISMKGVDLVTSILTSHCRSILPRLWSRRRWRYMHDYTRGLLCRAFWLQCGTTTVLHRDGYS